MRVSRVRTRIGEMSEGYSIGVRHNASEPSVSEWKGSRAVVMSG